MPARLASLLLLLALFASGAFAFEGGSDEVDHVAVAQMLISDQREIPGDDAPWQEVKLPYRGQKPDGAELTTYWFRSEFDLSHADNQLIWLYMPKLRNGGDIYVNGLLASRVRSSSVLNQVRWFQPFMLEVPPSLLRLGTNTIAVRFSARDPLTSFGDFYIGQHRHLEGPFEIRHFLESGSRLLTVTLCLAVGMFALAIWIRRPQEKLYSLFGFCALMWGARTVLLFTTVVPMHSWLLWRTGYYFTTGGFIACITLFLLQFSGFRNALLTRVLLGLWAAGCIAFLLLGPSIRPILDVYWQAAFLPFVAYAMYRVIRTALGQRTGASMAMLGTTLVALALALHDFSVQNGWFGLSEVYLLHLGIPAFLVAMLWAMTDRFIVSLELEESMNENLARVIAVRQSELAAQYEQMKHLERRNAAVEERQRIMQDMHDGIGSKLMAALMTVRQGHAEPQHIAALLQETIDEMRLVVDALSPDEPDLIGPLSDFRFRMLPRLERIGLRLLWRTENLPNSLHVGPYTALHVLRILHEATTNVIKHARAKSLSILVIYSGSCLEIRIEDDGVGMEDGGGGHGHGLANMRSRAAKIGATLTFEQAGSGCSVRLKMPLEETEREQRGALAA